MSKECSKIHNAESIMELNLESRLMYLNEVVVIRQYTGYVFNSFDKFVNIWLFTKKSRSIQLVFEIHYKYSNYININ